MKKVFFYKLTIISFILLLLCSEAFATNLNIQLNVRASGTVTKSSDSSPAAGLSVQVDWHYGNLFLNSVAYGTDENGHYGNNNYVSKTFTKINVSSNTTIPITFKFYVYDKDRVVATIEEDQNISFYDINTSQSTVNVSYNLNVSKDFSVTLGNTTTTTTGGGSVNNTSLTGVKEIKINWVDGSANGQITWLNEGITPRDHWVAINKLSEDPIPCEAGFRIGGYFPTAGGYSKAVFYPEEINQTYRIKICPIYRTDKSVGICKGGTCEATFIDTASENIYPTISKINDFQTTVSSNTNLFTNWAGLGESWYQDNTGQWYYYKPETNILYKDVNNDNSISKNAFIKNIAQDTKVADLKYLDNLIGRYPQFLRDKKVVKGNFPGIDKKLESLLLHYDIYLGLAKPVNPLSYYFNWSNNYQEHWFLSGTKSIYDTNPNLKWLYMLPDGRVYRWDGISGGANLTGTFVAKLPPFAYHHIEVMLELEERYIQRCFKFLPSTTNYEYNYNYQYCENHFQTCQTNSGNPNWTNVALYERWIKSAEFNKWYYIHPYAETSAALREWDYNYPIPIGDTIVHYLPYEVYQDPNFRLASLPTQ